jgi:hypothetical protein
MVTGMTGMCQYTDLLVEIVFYKIFAQADFKLQSSQVARSMSHQCLTLDIFLRLLWMELFPEFFVRMFVIDI